MKYIFSILFFVLFFLKINSSFAQNYTLRSYFNDELLTNSELSIFYDAPIHVGWCDENSAKKLNIPYHNLYLVWDTLRVSPYEFNMLNYEDSFTVSFTSFQSPVKGILKNKFGFTEDRFNYGIDISCPAGDSVVSPFEGIVRVAKSSRSYGNVVVIRNTNGTETVLSNLANVFVKTNQRIKSGELIGTLRFPENNFFIKSLKKLSFKKEIPMSFIHFEIRFLGQALDIHQILNLENGQLLDTKFTINKHRFNYLNDIRKYIISHKTEHKKQSRYR